MRLLSKQCHQCNNGWLEEPDQHDCHDSAKGVMFCNNCSFAYRITKADYAVKQEGANDKIEKVRKGGWIVRIVGEGVSA